MGTKVFNLFSLKKKQTLSPFINFSSFAADNSIASFPSMVDGLCNALRSLKRLLRQNPFENILVNFNDLKWLWTTTRCLNLIHFLVSLELSRRFLYARLSQLRKHGWRRVARSSVGGLNRARKQHTSSVREGTSGVLLFARSMKTVFAHSTISHPSRPLPLTAFTFLLRGECSSSVSFLLSVHAIYTSSYGFSSIFPSARNLFLTQRRQQQKEKRRRKFAPEQARRKQAKFYFRADGWVGAEAESFMMIWHWELLKKVSIF